jgi:hypothetical protein
MTMKRTFYLILPILLALVSFSCNKTPTSIDGGTTFQNLNGKAVNAGGMPLEGVGIHYIYYLDSASVPIALPHSVPTRAIQFCMPGEAVVSLSLLRYGSREHMLSFLDQELIDGGCFDVTFDGAPLFNGLYISHLTIGDSISENIVAILDTDVNYVIHGIPLTITDARGNFSLPYSVLGIGVQLTGRDASNKTYPLQVSNRIDLILYKEGYQPLVKTLYLNLGQSMNETFRLQ